MMKNESGRSMVEMLGVLAIIGVLSVGGIAGYTMAMRKYKANEAVSAASQCGMEAISANMGTGANSCPGVDWTKVSGVDSTGCSVSVASGVATVTVDFNGDSDLCDAAKAIKSGSSCADDILTIKFS